MIPKPAPRVAAALARTAALHHMRVSPAQIRILAGTACDEITRAESADDAPLPGTFLTSNQVALLKLAANGHTNEEIAAITCRSINTIKTQVRRILERLGAHDRGHAVAICLARGFLDPVDIRLPQGHPRGRPGRKPCNGAAV